MEQKLSTRLCERQVAELIEDDEVEPSKIIGEPPLPAGPTFCLQPVDQIDGVEEPAARSGADTGARDRHRQMVAILSTVLTDGLPAVEAACAQAMSEGVHSSDVIINILARQRDPGPAATILTPDALRLRHAPAADCARYDQLRST